MSEERFRWLEQWVVDPADIIRTPGSESNVKEIYDRCMELDVDPENIIFNQFSEFGNYLAHYACTGSAAARVVEALWRSNDRLRLRAFVAASGSAGTLGAGDYLKDRLGCEIVAAEALECPTLLYNGFGEHNIQGIGDKHVPLIHNVMNTDAITAISDSATDALDVVFNTEVGRRYLATRRGVPPEILDSLGDLGLSSICNLLAAIKTARYHGWGEDDVIVTVATDGADLYRSEHEKTLSSRYPDGFDEVDAAEAYGQYLLGVGVDHFMELTHRDRERVFNLGYFTWVEQQGLAIESFTRRRDPAFWRGLRDLLPAWDSMIEEFNAHTGEQVTS